MKLNSFWTQLAACAALSVAASAAHADTCNFVLTGFAVASTSSFPGTTDGATPASAGGASWQADCSPAVPKLSSGNWFVLEPVAVDFFGNPYPHVSLTFYNGTAGGGLALNNADDNGYEWAFAGGAQLYTGTEAVPAFTLGTYQLADYRSPGTYTLTISAVPEPATLALMLGGLGLVGFTASRRRAAD